MRQRLMSRFVGVVAAVLVIGACGGDNPLSTSDHITTNVIGAGAGSGYVYSDEPDVNIECQITAGEGGDSCDSSFDDNGGGGVFRLIAVPGEGSTFGGWSWSTGELGELGCTEVDGNICTLRFAQNVGDLFFTVHARFDLVTTGSPGR